jgi:hypothetical protein
MSDSTEEHRMDPTRPLEVDAPPNPAPDPDVVPAAAGTTWSTPPQDTPQDVPAPAEPATTPVGSAAPAGSVATAPVTRASRGPNTGAIVLGVLCLVLAGLAIARETSGFRVDWTVFGPGAIVGIGVLVLLLGVLGLARRQR